MCTYAVFCRCTLSACVEPLWVRAVGAPVCAAGQQLPGCMCGACAVRVQAVNVDPLTGACCGGACVVLWGPLSGSAMPAGCMCCACAVGVRTHGNVSAMCAGGAQCGCMCALVCSCCGLIGVSLAVCMCWGQCVLGAHNVGVCVPVLWGGVSFQGSVCWGHAMWVHAVYAVCPCCGVRAVSAVSVVTLCGGCDKAVVSCATMRRQCILRKLADWVHA